MIKMDSALPSAVPESDEVNFDPIEDIIDYLVRVANVNVYIKGCCTELRTSQKKEILHNLFRLSQYKFLLLYGKYLVYNHLTYFETLSNIDDNPKFKNLVQDLKKYLSEDGTKKRVRNRRYMAMLKLQQDGNYFSEKEMMYRNPLLYEQLVGQYLTNDEIAIRDNVDSANLTLSGMILDTVDKSFMREQKTNQLQAEKDEIQHVKKKSAPKPKRWGDFDDENESKGYNPKWGECENVYENACLDFHRSRKEKCISATERSLLKDEFHHEMYNSFLEGHDDYDYSIIDNDETLDNLQILDRDMEENYFDSEPCESNNLEESMAFAQAYGKKESSTTNAEDELDVYMQHLNKRLK